MSQGLPSRGLRLDSRKKHLPLVWWVVIEVSPGGNGRLGAEFELMEDFVFSGETA